MSKFKAGDRIRVYSCYSEKLGASPATVIHTCSDGILWIERDYGVDAPDGTQEYVHEKQCRKLKPKAPLRKIWLHKDTLPHEHVIAGYLYSRPSDARLLSGDFIEFVEVRKKGKK